MCIIADVLMLHCYIVTLLHFFVCKNCVNCEVKNLAVWKKMITFARR